MIIPFQSQIMVGGACAILAFGSCWWLRDQMAAHAALKAAHAETKAAVKVVERTAKAADITQAVGEKAAAKVEAVRVVYRDIIQKVPVYVTPEADHSCTVPVGAVRLHDAAASGSPPALPDSASPANDAPSGVALSEVLSVTAQNYGQCRETAEKLSGWQDWYREQKAAWEAK